MSDTAMDTPCKMIYLARRNPALDVDDFPAAWRAHSTLGKTCRNVQDKVTAVAQCSRLRGLLVRGASQDFDGVGLLHLRDREAADTIWNDPQTLATMRPDELRVFDGYVRDFTLMAEEHVLRRVCPGTDIVLYGFLRRRGEFSHAAFSAQWQATSVAWLTGVLASAACGVVHNAVVDAPSGYDFDGIAEWWFADAATLARACGKCNVRATLPDAADALVDLQTSVFVVTQVTHRRP